MSITCIIELFDKDVWKNLQLRKDDSDSSINKLNQETSIIDIKYIGCIYTYRMQENIMYLLCIVYKPLFSTYVRMHVCLSVRIHGVSV